MTNNSGQGWPGHDNQHWSSPQSSWPQSANEQWPQSAQSASQQWPQASQQWPQSAQSASQQWPQSAQPAGQQWPQASQQWPQATPSASQQWPQAAPSASQQGQAQWGHQSGGEWNQQQPQRGGQQHWGHQGQPQQPAAQSQPWPAAPLQQWQPNFQPQTSKKKPLVIGVAAVAVVAIAAVLATLFWPGGGSTAAAIPFKGLEDRPAEGLTLGNRFEYPEIMTYDKDHALVVSHVELRIEMWDLDDGEMDWQTSFPNEEEGWFAIKPIPDDNRVLVNVAKNDARTDVVLIDAKSGETKETTQVPEHHLMTVTEDGTPLMFAPAEDGFDEQRQDITILEDFDASTAEWSAEVRGSFFEATNLNYHTFVEHDDLLLVGGNAVTGRSMFSDVVDMDSQYAPSWYRDGSWLLLVDGDLLMLTPDDPGYKLQLVSTKGDVKWQQNFGARSASVEVVDDELYLSSMDEGGTWTISKTDLKDGQQEWTARIDDVDYPGRLMEAGGSLFAIPDSSSEFKIVELDPSTGDIESSYDYAASSIYNTLYGDDRIIAVGSDGESATLLAIELGDPSTLWQASFDGARTAFGVGQHVVLDKTEQDRGFVVLE